MSYPTWPSGLVQFERSGWQMQPQDARRRRQGDTGPPAYRRRFSSASRTLRLSLVLDRTDKAIFDRFYEDTTAEGSKLFWMPDPSTDRWDLLDNRRRPLDTGGGAPLLIAALWLVSFGDEVPVETMVGQSDFRKAFSVVIMP